MERPTHGEMIIAACGAFLLATSMLPLWGSYGCPTCPPEARLSRVTLWSEGFSMLTKLAMLLIAAVLIVILLRLVKVRLPWPPGRIYVGAGFLITLLLVLALVTGPSDLGFGHTSLLQVGRGPLLVVGWLFGLGMLFGGLKHMRETAASARQAGPGPVVLR